MTADIAVAIVNALRAGTVPAEGLHHFAVGLDAEAAALRGLREFVGRGHGAYKFVRGSYGSGKTFLTSLAAAEACDDGFAVSQVVISVADTPLYRLAEIYRRMCQGLATANRKSGALQSIVDQWLYGIEQQVVELDRIAEDAPEFDEAVGRKLEAHLAVIGTEAGRLAACLRAYHEAQFRQDFGAARGILDWVAGEPKVSAGVKRAAGVTGQLDSTDTLTFLQGLLLLMRATGSGGLVLVLDEAETVLRMRRTERQTSLEVMRQLIDAIDRNRFPGLLLLVTGTPDFFDSPHGVPSLEPLHQRIRVDFRDDEPDNLRQPQIRLRAFDRERLEAVAKRVRELYPARDSYHLGQRIPDRFVASMAEAVTRGFGGHVELAPRLFLREFIHVLDLVDQHPDYDPAARYAFEPEQAGIALRAEEESALGITQPPPAGGGLGVGPREVPL